MNSMLHRQQWSGIYIDVNREHTIHWKMGHSGALSDPVVFQPVTFVNSKDCCDSREAGKTQTS